MKLKGKHKMTKDDDKAFKILSVVSEFYKIPIDKILSKTRVRKILEKRQLCHFITSKLTNLSLAAVGYNLGGYDHATVSNSIKIIENIVDTDRNFRQEYERILAECKRECKKIDVIHTSQEGKNFFVLRGTIFRACRMCKSTASLEKALISILLTKIKTTENTAA